MKTLLIMRHAKSSRCDPQLTDFERPLNARGLLAAPFMGRLMRRRGLVPDIMIASTAVRALQTANLVYDAAGFDGELRTDARIYEAGVQSLVNIASEINDAYSTTMLVGHNPGMEGLIGFLTANFEPMPTAAVAVISLNIENWKAINDGCGELKIVYRPKDEMK